jgi:hypothetical protein
LVIFGPLWFDEKMGDRYDYRNGALVFVYNAESGLFNAVTDTAHKIFSPQTYNCKLCALTYSAFGMRKSWKRFLETLNRPLEFLHADELQSRYGISGVRLPALFKKEGERLELAIDAEAINACRTIEDLQQLIKVSLPLSC